MKNCELISHVAREMLGDRTDKLAGGEDSLYSDALIARYLTEAEKILCRKAWVLEDSTSPQACQISLVENKYDYPIHSKVLFVKTAKLSDSDMELIRVGHADNTTLNARTVYDPDFWNVNTVLTETAGRPDRFATDMGTRRIRVRRKPDATAAALKLQMTVVRMPLNAITTAAKDKEPEIPEEFHLDLTLFAAGKCLSHPLVDAGDRRQGLAWLEEFEGRVKEAKRDRMRFQQSEPQFRFGGWAGAD